MKKILPLMGAGFALVTTAFPLYAQQTNYSNSKGEANIVRDAQYLSPESNQNAAPSAAPASNVANTEPQAGESDYEDFTGFYAGGDIGYNMSNYDVDGAGLTDDAELNGWEGGVFVGYGFNHNFSWIGSYMGIEAGYEWSGADDSVGGVGFEKDNAMLITLRPGLTVYNDVLGYGIIGYSRAEFDGNGESEDLDGLVLGAGGEFNTGTPLKGRLEYTYTNYEDTDLNGIDFDGYENQFKMGAVYRF